MDTLRNIAEEALEFRRWGKLVSVRSLAVSIVISLPCLFAGFLCLCIEIGGRIETSPQLGNARFPFVQFGVKRADLP